MEIIIPKGLDKFKDKIYDNQTKISSIKPLMITKIAKNEKPGYTQYLCALKNNTNYKLQVSPENFSDSQNIHNMIPNEIVVGRNKIFIFAVVLYGEKDINLDYGKMMNTINETSENNLTKLEELLNLNQEKPFEENVKVVEDVDLSATTAIDAEKIAQIQNKINQKESLDEKLENVDFHADKKSHIENNFLEINKKLKDFIVVSIKKISLINNKYDFEVNISNISMKNDIKINEVSINAYEKSSNELIKSIILGKQIYLTAGSGKKIKFSMPEDELDDVDFKKVILKTKLK